MEDQCSVDSLMVYHHAKNIPILSTDKKEEAIIRRHYSIYTAACAAFFLPLDSSSDESEFTVIFFGAFMTFGLVVFAFGSPLAIGRFLVLLAPKSKSLELSISTAFFRPAAAVVVFLANNNISIVTPSA